MMVAPSKKQHHYILGQFFASIYRFEYGIGTQVMLASAVFSPVSEQLMDSARKLLKKDEVTALKRKLADVCYHGTCT